MIKIINKLCAMSVSKKDIPANTVAEVSVEEYQKLCIFYPDTKRILEPVQEVVLVSNTYKIEKVEHKEKKCQRKRKNLYSRDGKNI